MAPPKKNAATKSHTNAETASNISAEASEKSDKSAAKGRGKKAKEVEKVAENVKEKDLGVAAKEDAPKNATFDVEEEKMEEDKNDGDDDKVEENAVVVSKEPEDNKKEEPEVEEKNDAEEDKKSEKESAVEVDDAVGKKKKTATRNTKAAANKKDKQIKIAEEEKEKDEGDNEEKETKRPTRGRKQENKAKDEEVEETKTQEAESANSKKVNTRQTRHNQKVDAADKVEAAKNGKEAAKNKKDTKKTKQEDKSEAKKTKQEDSKSDTKKEDQKDRKRKLEEEKEDVVEEKKSKKPKIDKKFFATTANISKSAIPGVVLTMGMNDVGQLGLGADVSEKSRASKVDVEGVEFVQISAGGMHSLCLASNGEVYSFGCNDEATLGRQAEDEGECAVPKKVVGIKEKVVQVAAGDSHSVALDIHGQVYIWGTFRDNNGVIGINPEEEEMEVDGEEKTTSKKGKKKQAKDMGKSEKIESPSKILQDVRVIKIASGSAHILCLSDMGEVYSLGASDFGQLGRVAECFSNRGGRRGIDSTLSAKLVRFRKRTLKCADIWAGAYSSFAKSSDGEIYSWGLNNYYQIGFPDMVNRFTPEMAATFDPSFDWKEIACAEHHTIALDGNGRVYSIGRKDYGRLGLGSLERIDHAQTLSLVKSLDSKKCTSVGCGSSVSFAVGNDGVVYSWGMGSNNQMGRGEDEEDVLEPTPISGKQLENLKVVMATAGGQHSMLLARKA